MRNTDFSYDTISVTGNGDICEILPGISLGNANIEHGNYTCIVELAKEFIRKNFTRKIGVDDIAKNVFTSQYHFSRIFKKHTSYSPYQYLIYVRLQQAMQLMYQKELSITEISFRSGFSSVDYFSAAFAKKYKLSPSGYRKTLRTLQG
jgi:AraC-like DNA-binding protein